jgi:anthranilate phosphoribosyltransferase
MNSEEIINKASLKNLTQEETSSVMEDIFLGHISDQKIEDFLLNLSKKGETSDELTGAVKAMRNFSLKVKVNFEDHLVDCCGTGGLGKSMMNVSTTAGLIAASAKVKIAKHGNRTSTGKSGSADVLLPCFAILTFADAAISPAVVETFIILFPSPPVPQQSTK